MLHTIHTQKAQRECPQLQSQIGGFYFSTDSCTKQGLTFPSWAFFEIALNCQTEARAAQAEVSTVSTHLAFQMHASNTINNELTAYQP